MLTVQSHVNPIKYTCPRDGVHTCSLPCVKRHKQWAQCSGVRDPAEYRKRSELATASSIDKDFNFITKVERSLSRADETAAERGIDLVPARLRPHDARPKFELEAEARGIKIIKAPKGLSRSKQNKTHWGGQSKCIIWSVEWICHDGRRAMSAAPENQSVKELFDAAFRSRRHARKRKRPSDTEDAQDKSVISEGFRAGVRGKDQGKDEGKAPTDALQPTLPPAASESLRSEVQEILEPDMNQDVVPSTSAETYFYLHRPNTESRYKCLIPLDASLSLQNVLKDKTLIEFPTIYVQTEPPDQLEAPFITEEEYIRRHGVDIPINIATQVPNVTEDAELEEGELDLLSAGKPSVTEKKVLEVLAQDLASGLDNDLSKSC